METCCGYGYGPASEASNLPRIFKGRRQLTGHRGRRGALQRQHPYLRSSLFQGVRLLTKKRKLFPGLPPTSPGSVALPRMVPKDLLRRLGSGILNRFPFDYPRGTYCYYPRIFRMAFAYVLGPTDPCSTAVHMEPFSTSVFKVLV